MKDSIGGQEVSRRGFINFLLGATGGAGALAAALSPLRELDGNQFSLDRFLQKHYRKLSPRELAQVLERIEKEVRRDYRIPATVDDRKSQPGVEFGYALNLGRCIGCRRCVHACVKENNQSRNPQIQYIRVLQMPLGTIDLERGDHHYSPDRVPDRDHFYMPIQCQQCKNPPCVKVCPVGATWQEPDGLTVIDYDWCIGCRYCEAACPYWARRFNFTRPGFNAPQKELTADMNYLSNRPRAGGVMEKCTFCLHRTRAGRMPACLEACPVGARKFGNLLDPESEVRQVLANKHVFVLKQDLGTEPRFFYFFDQEYPGRKRSALYGKNGGPQ